MYFYYANGIFFRALIFLLSFCRHGIVVSRWVEWFQISTIGKVITLDEYSECDFFPYIYRLNLNGFRMHLASGENLQSFNIHTSHQTPMIRLYIFFFCAISWHWLISDIFILHFFFSLRNWRLKREKESFFFGASQNGNLLMWISKEFNFALLLAVVRCRLLFIAWKHDLEWEKTISFSYPFE